MSKHSETNTTDLSSDDELTALYDDLRFYAAEAKSATSPFEEGSVYDDIETTMAKIRHRRQELKENQG